MICKKCEINKSEAQFEKRNGTPTGRRLVCKLCRSTARKAYYLANHDRLLARLSELRSKARANGTYSRRNNYPSNRDKALVRAMVNNALASGKIEKSSCVHCGETEVESHHRDYSKPLDIIWVCFICHREIEHGQLVSNRIKKEYAEKKKSQQESEQAQE